MRIRIRNLGSGIFGRWIRDGKKWDPNKHTGSTTQSKIIIFQNKPENVLTSIIYETKST
jgi:hypothetical protein